MFLQAKYEVLPAKESVTIRKDRVTDQLAAGGFEGYRLREPLLPGRGEGVADVPTVKIMHDVDPSDVAQGRVGDCWLVLLPATTIHTPLSTTQQHHRTQHHSAAPFSTRSAPPSTAQQHHTSQLHSAPPHYLVTPISTTLSYLHHSLCSWCSYLQSHVWQSLTEQFMRSSRCSRALRVHRFSSRAISVHKFG